jgi:HD-like signal output (HDOD) protein/DNA-binding response OmpR family regulator
VDKIIFATRQRELVNALAQQLKGEFEVFTASTRQELSSLSLKSYAALILDQNVNENNGIDILMTVVSVQQLPVLALVEPDDAQYASEALRSGASNYVLKTPGFERFIHISITDAINRFNDQARALEKIRSLENRIADMEVALGIDKDTVEIKEQEVRKEKKKELLTEIGNLLRSGDFSLPGYPMIAANFRKLVEAGATVSQISAELEHDPGIVSRLVSIANSVMYAGVSRITSVEQALSRIGLSDSLIYVEMAQTKSYFAADDKVYKPIMLQLWQHSLACAYAAKETARLLKYGNPSQYFSLGLFHDIGKLVLIRILTELADKEALAANLKPADINKLLQTQHCQFGNYILEVWDMPEIFRQIASWHEAPEEAGEQTKELVLIDFANTLANLSGYAQGDPELINIYNFRATVTLGLEREQVNAIRAEVNKRMEDRAFS